MGCTMSSRTETGNTEREYFHQSYGGHIEIDLDLQKDLAFEGCGRPMGCVLAQDCAWGRPCYRGWLIVLHELSTVNGATLGSLRQLGVSLS